ncbi:MAG: tetratricopeptide repeat protein [Acidobacteriota bacterium]|nr:tetratricopeptide repeat protein [Acidobacteriota bacterium]
MRISRQTFSSATVLSAIALLAIPSSLLGSGGGSSPSPTPPPPVMELTARDHYERGLKLRDKAWELEEKATKEPEKAEKYLKKAGKEFEKAARSQREAIKMDSRMYQAYSSLGYALRRLGDYAGSIKAYDQGLAIEPRYAEAIEYRAEAYLGLGRLDEAKDAYMHLFRADRARADELLEAMQKWVDEKRATAGDQMVEDFAAWVAERTQLAVQTAMVGSGRTW